MGYEDNPFIENTLHENVTMVISESFFALIDKAVNGYCPYAKVDTFFISEKEAKHYSWQNGWEVGVNKLDLTGKNKDFIADYEEELEPVGSLSVDNAIVLLNGIIRKWEKYESEETPAGVVCDVQYAGRLNEYNVFIVPIGYKSQWDNTIMISYLFSSFAEEWISLMPEIEKKIKKFKKLQDATLLIDNDEVTKRACINKLNEIFGQASECRRVYDVITRLAIQSYESQYNHGTMTVIEEVELEKNSIVKYSKSIPLKDDAIRQIRKVLEIAKNGWDILVSKNCIVGMGKAIPNLGKVIFKKPGCWDLLVGSNLLFTAEANKFHIVISPEDVPFYDKFRECFNKSGKWESLEKIIKDAQEQRHGTTIIISDAAKDEAKRLCDLGYGIAVSPFAGDSIEGAIKASTAIDGAVLVDRKGTCFAIGVILDGSAQIAGNPARGARFNSVKNYLASPLYMGNTINAMAVIVSEDGSTDVMTSVQIKRENPQLIGNG